MSKKIRILNPDRQMDVPFDQQLTMGRDIYNSLNLQDPDCSRSHAIIFEQEDRAIIKDLNSRNGVYVNGEKVFEQSVTSGDEIILGSTVMVFDPPERFNMEKTLSERGKYILNKQASRKRPDREEPVSYYNREQMDKAIHRLFTQPEGASFFSLSNAMSLLRTFYEMANSPDTKELLRATLKRTLSLIGGERGVVMESDAAKKKLKVRSIIANDDEAIKIEIPRQVLKVVLQDECCVFCSDVLADDQFAQIVSKDRHPVHSFVAAPIVADDQYYGFIYLDTQDKSRSYDYIAMRSLYLITSLLAALLKPQTTHYLHTPTPPRVPAYIDIPEDIKKDVLEATGGTWNVVP